MATAQQPIKCKSCTRILATVSPTGLLPATAAPQTQGCDTCGQFSTLYEAMQAADLELANLADKAKQNRVKQAAIEQSKRLHLEFGNWLFGVEAPRTGAKEETSATTALKLSTEGQLTQGTKRARSLSVISQEQPREESGNIAVSQAKDLQPQGVHDLDLPIPHRPSLDRCHSATGTHERKRIRFSDSVEFREDYPNYLTINRLNEGYVPGRYAPPSDGYLDTSGADLGWVQFTGMRKVGNRFVEVNENEDEEKTGKVGGGKKGKEIHKLESVRSSVTPETASVCEQGESGEGTTSGGESRAESLARRTSRTLGIDVGADGEEEGEGHNTVMKAEE